MNIHIILSLALLMFSFGLFQYANVVARKLALLSLWLSSGLFVWGLSGSVIAGAGTLALWVLFPVSEMVFVLRRLRVPLRRALEDSPPPFDEFPELADISADFEDLGFGKAGDFLLKPAQQEQFFRLFSHESEPVYGAVGCISQGGFGFHFTMFFSEDKTGRLWITWDYPLAYGLVTPPQIALHRVLDCECSGDVLEEHTAFLEVNGLGVENLMPCNGTRDARELLERIFSTQLEYNVSIGILAPNPEEKTTFRYSWRGALYVAGQVVRDLVRM